VARARALTRALALALTLALAALPVLAVRGTAQRVALQPEVRADVLGPAPYVYQVGAGVTKALGYYARLTVAAAFAPGADSRYVGDRWRGDIIARVLMDPFKQQRWALSIGGGLSVRRQTYLAAVADLEGPDFGGVMPAIQVGVSGGLRAGVVLRRAIRGRR